MTIATSPSTRQPTPPDARSRLLTHFSTPSSTPHYSRWSELWDAGDFLPWDRGAANPALEAILAQRRDLIGRSWVEGIAGQDGQSLERRRKRALVPGCGRGYDVLLLAKAGYDAWGLEISGSAVRMAMEYVQSEEQKSGDREKGESGEEKNGSEEMEMGKVRFVVGDFFEDGWRRDIASEEGVEGKMRFDLIYDYTFLSALPPTTRPAWALRMSQLLSPSPFGNLICIEFPTYKPASTGGPPWGLPPKVYMEHLSHPGEELPYDEEGNVKENVLRRASEGGLERVAHWMPERTHEIGKGTDWVSVWRHM